MLPEVSRFKFSALLLRSRRSATTTRFRTNHLFITMTVAEVYRKAGFPAKHGEACQEVANETDRIIVSRCAQEIGIQLLEENYASKGFGIKAKSCDWGPFAGFAMGHFQYSKFETGEERYKKQIAFFKSSGHTGFENEHIHMEMARPMCCG